MYKIITLIALLLISISSKSQVILQSYSVMRGEWSNYSENWIWDKPAYCGITFRVTGNVIEADDIAESTYYTYEEFIVKKHEYLWRAFDEDGEKCIVGITTEPNMPSTFYVMYDNVIFKYFVK